MRLTALLVAGVCVQLAPSLLMALDQNDPALVGVWLYDEGQGTTVGDIKNGNDGTVVGDGFTWSDGKFGSAIVAPGPGSIDVPDSDSIGSISSGLTVASWFRIDADSNTGIRKNGAFLLEDQSDAEPVPNGFSFRVWTDQGITPGLYGKTELVQGEWYHIAGTYDGSKVEMYVNGEPESAIGVLDSGGGDWTPEWAGNVTSGSPLQLKFGPEDLTGALDETVILNRAITQDEVRQLMNGWASVPEPSSFCLFALGAMFALKLRRKT